MYHKPDGSLHYSLALQRSAPAETGRSESIAYAIAEATYELESLTKEQPEIASASARGRCPVAIRLGPPAILEKLISHTLLRIPLSVLQRRRAAGLEDSADREEDLRSTAYSSPAVLIPCQEC
jgi:hypothetical protein